MSEKTLNVGFMTRNGNDGLWSDAVPRDVRIHMLNVNTWEDNLETSDFAELRAYFNTRDWGIRSLGLLYTDEGWMKTFKENLRKMGFSEAAIKDVDYSEQGMQGDDFVSMDVGDAFIREFVKYDSEAIYEVK